MKPIEKGKIFKPNIELLLMLGKNRRNGWKKVVEDPRAFVKSDRKFEPIMDKKGESEEKEWKE